MKNSQLELFVHDSLEPKEKFYWCGIFIKLSNKSPECWKKIKSCERLTMKASTEWLSNILSLKFSISRIGGYEWEASTKFMDLLNVNDGFIGQAAIKNQRMNLNLSFLHPWKCQLFSHSHLSSSNAAEFESCEWIKNICSSCRWVMNWINVSMTLIFFFSKKFKFLLKLTFNRVYACENLFKKYKISSRLISSRKLNDMGGFFVGFIIFFFHCSLLWDIHE